MSEKETDDEGIIICIGNLRRSGEINTFTVALDQRVKANKKRTEFRRYSEECYVLIETMKEGFDLVSRRICWPIFIWPTL